MKARKLKELMNGIDYMYHYHNGKVCIGSYMCHDLISVDAKTLKVEYALDTFHEGRKALKNEELEFIWDKLHELIESGEIHDIINGRDVIENPLPVFTIKNGELVKRVTDSYVFPNTDENGILMYEWLDTEKKYEYTHFPTTEQALYYGFKMHEKRISELEKEIEKKATENGYKYVIVRDLDSFIQTVNEYLKEN